ncbi:flagellar basal body-associated FliL family protein [Thiohalophilus sp.]|uniref:flagellar basal body-associated FliL family protein n=1 Tax=Thiohalophilus sp. TaxID=3028392 RepID=UPI002ACE2BE3|nr:flagellar basal body-associated FliL family protein [Thiohalophilus sp.]MDZ7804168.1 flagellar basal body-associated FliL family protein [Thiohalophilus sp.]
MADNEQDLDLDVKSGNKLNTILLVVLIVLVLAVAGAGAAWYLLSGDDDTAAAGDEEGESAEVVEAQPKPAHYFKLEPEFVVNFEDPGKARYLQLEIQLMARDAEVFEQAKTHMPVIRSELLILFSEQTFEELSSREGKLRLREETLKTINQILQSGEDDAGIEQVYFTSLIMQ